MLISRFQQSSLFVRHKRSEKRTPCLPFSEFLMLPSQGNHNSRRYARCQAANVAVAAAAAAPVPGGTEPASSSGSAEVQMSEVAKENLAKAANACRRYGWISFWTQLVLSTISAIILLFSLAFTSQVHTALLCLQKKRAARPGCSGLPDLDYRYVLKQLP